MSAEDVANRLAYDFLKMGRFSASAGPVEVPWLAAGAASAAHDADGLAETAAAFGGLSVQSVGFEEGPDDPKVHVYLTRGSAREMKALSTLVDGVPVRLHKMGAITVRPDASGMYTNRGNIFERNDRVCCGTSCGPTSELCSGTLGALVNISGSPDIFLLSNNHVFAGCNHVPMNQPILAPSSHDGRPDARAPAEIGRHHQILELRSGNPNFVDACETDLAIARASDPSTISSWQGDGPSGYDTPRVIAAPSSLMKVKKFGRTTALTHGEIEAKIGAPTPVNYVSKHFKGLVWFRDVWTVRARGGDPFALGGDSGSLVVTEDGTKAVGLVFAANPSGDYAWIVPMPTVAASFGGLRLVTDHGVTP